jgi:hypothetical protein
MVNDRASLASVRQGFHQIEIFSANEQETAGGVLQPKLHDAPDRALVF